MRRQLLRLALIAPLLVAFSPLGTAAQTTESVTIYADDCRTPKTTFVLGEVVCVQAGSFPVFPSAWRERRLQWATPGGTVVQEDEVYSDPRYEYFKIPYSGPYAQVGKWTVKTINVDSDGYAVGRFVVRNSLSYIANLELVKVASNLVQPGTKVSQRVYIYNQGPDTAERITLTENIPKGMFFLGWRQYSGPAATCKTPPSYEGGQITCTFYSIRTEDKVELLFTYGVSDLLKEGDVLSSTSEVWAYTEEADKKNNYAFYEGVIYIPPAEQPCPECDGQ